MTDGWLPVLVVDVDFFSLSSGGISGKFLKPTTPKMIMRATTQMRTCTRFTLGIPIEITLLIPLPWLV